MYKMTWPEVEEYLKENDLIIFPVGSQEQHGKHLAEDNDSFTATEIARRVGERTGVLVAPTMPFGNSVHHMNFPGTMTLTFETLVAAYRELCECLIHHGFRKIVVMNAHGGNTAAIAQALREIKEDTDVTVYSLMAFPSQRGFGAESTQVIKQESGGHACELETSIELYLGQRVLMDKAEKWKVHKARTAFDEKWARKVSWTRDFDWSTEIGSLGDPEAATAEKGKAMVEATVDEISAFIEDLKKL